MLSALVGLCIVFAATRCYFNLYLPLFFCLEIYKQLDCLDSVFASFSTINTRLRDGNRLSGLKVF